MSGYYSTKHGAAIYISGDVMPELLQHSQRIYKRESAYHFNELTSAPDAHIKVIEEFWPHFCNEEALHSITNTSQLRDSEVEKALYKKIADNTNWIRDKWNEVIKIEWHSRMQNTDQIGLSASQAESELKTLATKLDAVSRGYLFQTCLNNRHGQGHAETFVVSSAGIVINVIPYGIRGVPYVNGQYSANISRLTSSLRLSRPLATNFGCETLGISYLKEYLKEDAKQLNENTLLVHLHNHEMKIDFHLASPQVLIKYSQSTQHIKLVHAMVAGERNQVSVSHPEEEIQVYTLQGLISMGAIVFRPDGKAPIGGIEAFRESWLKLYAEHQPLRLSMCVNNKNKSLTYASHRLKEKVKNLNDGGGIAPNAIAHIAGAP